MTRLASRWIPSFEERLDHACDQSLGEFLTNGIGINTALDYLIEQLAELLGRLVAQRYPNATEPQRHLTAVNEMVEQSARRDINKNAAARRAARQRARDRRRGQQVKDLLRRALWSCRFLPGGAGE